MNDHTILQNQILIMKSMIALLSDDSLIKELYDQIMFTEARLRALS